MKKIDNFMTSVDRQIDKYVPGAFFEFMKKHFVYFSSMLLIGIFGLFVYQVLKERPYYLATVIKTDLDQIEKTLSDIDKNCNILSIAPRALVDFLNVEKFVGSMVGCLNLAYPDQWKGPYLHRNPTLQGIFYELVKTQDGFYIVPGSGVKLPNGLIMGKHLRIDGSTQILQMVGAGGHLNHNGEKLARKLNFIIGDWDSPIQKTTGKLEKISNVIKEFSDALSCAQSDQILQNTTISMG